LGGSGGGGGGVEDCPGTISGSVVNGWETALSKCAHPAVSAVAAHTAATADLGGRNRMPQGYGLFGRMRHDGPNRDQDQVVEAAGIGNADWPLDVRGKSAYLPAAVLTLAL
jgi:hypothetical protein